LIDSSSNAFRSSQTSVFLFEMLLASEYNFSEISVAFNFGAINFIIKKINNLAYLHLKIALDLLLIVGLNVHSDISFFNFSALSNSNSLKLYY
jgi:hypothetical protein